MDFKNRIKHAWNAFMNKDPTPQETVGPSYGVTPANRSYSYGFSDRSIVNSIINRVSRDVAAIDFIHASTDENGHFLKVIKDSLNECLTVEANLDQTGKDMIQDAVTRMLESGFVAIVPIECDNNPNNTGTYEIYELRCAEIIQWYPSYVRVKIYDERDGQEKERIFAKDIVAIVQNPLYEIMNKPNSLPNRINRKLALLDVIDNENGSTKLNMIIQVPYNTRSPVKQQYAENRINELENQLANSPRGIGYMDINEKIIPLSKPLENNLLEHIKYLSDLYKSQIGISDAILNNTANEAEYNNYSASIIEPICVALCDEMKRKFFTKTARSKGHSIIFYRDQFRNVPVTAIAKIADTLSRNQIMTPNELRQKMGMPPSDDPKADELNNANMPDENPGMADYANMQMMPQDEMDQMQQPMEPETPMEAEIPDDQNQNEFQYSDNPQSLFSLFK